jgi:tRNA (cmo5U34)-methyltransferase
VVTPRFPQGLTWYDVHGQWQDQHGAVRRLDSHNLAILYADSAAANRRRFIPRYDEMLDEAIRFIGNSTTERGKFVDLGTGTGSLAERLLQLLPEAQVIGIDADPKMLEEAARRPSGKSEQLKLKLQDFFSELPTAQDAYFAALALHHVVRLPSKETLYQKICEALVPDGIFVNADAMFDESNSNQIRNRWAAHLISCGFTETEAMSHLQNWRKEDFYYSLQTELDLLRRAGFSECDVLWRYGPMAVVAGRK